MGKVTKKEMPIWAKMGHRKPVTRREFLGYGMIPFAASALVPNALGLLTPTAAEAQEAPNCATASGNLAPFVTLNLAGGAGISANFVPFQANGQPLPSYTKMGLGNNTGANALTFQSEFGVAQWAPNSPMLAGIRATAQAATLANSAAVMVCVQSRDDSGENRFDASGMVFKAGLVGQRLPNLGRSNTPTGLNMQAAYIAPPPPLVVGSFTDITNSIGYTRALAANTITAAQRQKLTNLVKNLSGSQAKKFMQISSTAEVKDLVECAGIKNTELIAAGAGAVDPVTQAPNVAAVWGFDGATAANNENRVFGSMVYNGLVGNAGTVNLNRGGYDYHDGTRTTGDQRDNQAGQVIGRILQTAAVLQRKVFIYLTSDGSVVSAENAAPGAVWTSDRGGAGLAVMFMYDPAGRPATTGAQVGAYNAGQSAEVTNPAGGDPAIAAQAVFANWVKFSTGSMSLFEKVVLRGTLSGAVLDSVVKVG